MDCDFKYIDLVKKSNPKSTLKVLQSNRNVVADLEREEVHDEKKLVPLPPSEYMKQMLSCPEILLSRNTNNERTKSSIFTPNPRVVVFKKFEIGCVYNNTLTIRNTSYVPHYLRLLSSENVFFNVTFKGSTLNTRLVPGMTHIYNVEFRPDERRNYFHDIAFKSDAESFVVKVIAVGPQALLSFPDQIDMEQTAVKVDKIKPILLQNIGEVFTGFSIYTDNPCFKIKPPKGSVEPGQAMQVHITFTPTRTKITNGNIFLRYETGDIVQSIIYGEGVKCDVRIYQETITIENTYLGLSRLVSIGIENKSDYLLRFEWLQYKSIDEDLEEKEKCKTAIEERTDLQQNNALDPSVRELIRRRIYSDEIQLLAEKSLTFCNDHYSIFPTSGEAWPRNKMEVSLLFKPQEVGTLNAIAYLEIDGQEDRIPVCLFGKCIGPALELNLLSLNIQKVYLCSTYCYEVVCRNIGAISGTLIFMQKDANFGSTIKVEPGEIEVNLGDLKCMKLSFYSNRTGDFIERVDFLIKESQEILSFVLKGTVICPLIKTNEDEINFHRASLCFSMKKQVDLYNLSHTPIEFDIRVLSDGYEMPITHEEYARLQIKPKFPCCPREFLVMPSRGVIQPKTSLQLQVTYTPNIVRSGETQIQIQMCESSNAEPLLLPMKFQAKRAALSVTPNEIIVPFCFVNYPYNRNLTITNPTKIDSYFYFVPQEILSDTAIYYSLSTYQGYLKPGKSRTITLTLIVKRVGLQNTSLSLLSLGFETQTTCCEIICDGQGPVVFSRSTHLDWREVQLLQTKSLTLELTNDSPISAEFTTSLNKTKNVWQVEPSSGEINSWESIFLEVSLKLRDIGKYSDKLTIAIFNGKPVVVNLLAIGVGTCVVFDPEIYPKFDMGFLFSHQDLSIPITIKNEGTRHHLVLLTNVEKVRQTKKNLTEEIEGGKFRIEPSMVELLPGSEQIINCKVRSNVTETITEKWFVYATIEAQGKRELQGTSEFVATFIEPNVIFNTHELKFVLDIGWNDVRLQQSEELHIRNQSGRDLSAHLTIDSPFVMIDKCNCCTEDIDIILIDSEQFCIEIYFPFDVDNSELLPQQHEGYLKIEYEEHKNFDKIFCKAQVNYPHVAFESNVINLYCASGYSDEYKAKLINDTSLPVFYKIKWMKETFRYEKLFPLMQKDSLEGSMISRTASTNTAESKVSLKDQYEPSESKILLKDKCEPCKITKQIKQDLLPSENDELNLIDYYDNTEELSEKSFPDLQDDIIDLIDKFLQIAPEEGQIFPYTEQYVSIIFNGLENAKVSAQAICEVAGGSSQILYVNAISDTVKCDVPRYEPLDFGLQLFCGASIATLKLTNQCLIPLRYHIEMSSDLLRVVDGPEMLDANSESLIVIERQPSSPGKYSEKLFLEITHLELFVVNVQWFATIPQIYIQAPRDDSFSNYSVLFGYQAVQMIISETAIQDEFTLEPKCSTSDTNSDILDISEYEMMQLIDNNWHVITCDEKYPSQVDIDMAFERLIVRDYIESTENAFEILNAHLNNKEIPFLSAPAYVINMKFVLIDKTAHFSFALRNYGYEKANVKLIKEKKKSKTSKTYFNVHLEKNTEICQCESSLLNIIFSPKKDIFTQRRTDVNYKFQLEVKLGLTIPINVQASAVYPYLIASVQTLNFDKNFVGDCREMSFILTNDGFVESQWEICIENPSKYLSKSTENPFCVSCINGVLSPNQETIIRVYFKPYKNGIQKRNLMIMVADSQETAKIRLVGCGIVRIININKTCIKFPAVTPNTETLEENLIVANESQYPLELYWHHRDNFTEANNIIRILRHYYSTDEIVIPQRKIGENIPDILINFYKCLAYQMYLDDDFKEIVKNMLADVRCVHLSDNALFDSKSKTRTEKRVNKGQSMPDLKRITSKEEIERTKSLSMLARLSNLNPNGLENLLHEYIDKLQSNVNFCETMSDPLGELYENNRQENYCENIEDLEKKLVIIFHGAPFTKYQEMACRTARVLNLPLLNISQLLLETAAFVETQSAKDFTKHLDNRYKEATAKFTALVLKKSSLLEESNKIQHFSTRLPNPEELEQMGAYDQWEHKLEVISQVFGDPETSSSKPKDKGNVKSKETTGKRQNILPNVGEDLLRDILRERILQPKFKNGYVLQTLNNDFVRNESTILKILLEVTGKVETRWFITFFNSLELYELRVENLNRMKAKEEERRINDLIKNFDKMAESQINQLSEDDKQLYNDFINEKRQEMKRSTETSKHQDIIVESFTVARVKKTSKSTSLNLNKKVIADITSKKKETKNQDLDKIVNSMKEYENSLSKILEIINEWTARKSVDTSKSRKRKSKLVSTMELTVKPIEDFFIWHIHSKDPWDAKMYDAILCQMKLSFATFENDESSKDDSIQRTMKTQTYTILKEYGMCKLLQSGIISISPRHPSTENYELECESKIGSDESAEILTSSTDILSPRCFLPPRESREYKVEFSPKEEGCFEAEFLLSLVDNPDTSFHISVSGFAQFPKLDLTPCSVFDRVQSTKVSESHQPMYYLDSRVYDFGNLLVMQMNDDRSYKKSTQFNFKNISCVSAAVNFSLLHEQYDCFDINPRQMKIKANETGTIDVTACALKFGCISDSLVLSMNASSNQEPETIELTCNGIKLNVDLQPKKIDLDRILLHKTEKRMMMLRNKSAITIYWRLSMSTDEPQIKLIPSEGKLKYKGCCEIELLFYASKVIKADIKLINLELFLNEKNESSVAHENITITLETYEIIFELSSNFIDLENMTVGSTKKESFTIKNLGLYEIEYKIEYEDNEVLKKMYDLSIIETLKDDFIIHPNVGRISAKKSATVNLTFTPSIEINLKSVPLLKCLIIEPHKNAGIAKDNLIHVSAFSCYTRFSIEPYPVLNFGILGLKETKAMTLKITNIGNYPLKYSIQNQTSQSKNDCNVKNKKKPSKSSKRTSKQATKKGLQSKWEPFYLEPLTGELDQGLSDMIAVRCCSDFVGYFDEKLVFLVTDSLPVKEGYRQVSLIANVCVPELDFKNYNNIFAESHVVNSFSDFIPSIDLGEHSVFSVTSNCLHFCRVCIGSCHDVGVTLRNISFIDSDLIIEIPETFSTTNPFRVDTNQLCIPSMSKQNFTITFSPGLLGKFSSLLNIRVNLPQNAEQQTFSINLEGESCVPQIRILEPALESNETSIDFGLSFLYEKHKKICKIQNIGQVTDEIVIEKSDCADDAYRIYIDTDKYNFESGCFTEKAAGNILNAQIAPRQILNVIVHFVPTRIEKYESRLKILLRKNPYEVFEVDLLGEGFSRSVVFENLEIIDASLLDVGEQVNSDETDQSSLKTSESVMMNLIPLVYKLDYERCFLNQTDKLSFKISNKTSDRYFRFEINPHPNIVFTPSAGHLPPCDYKELTASFLALEPIILCQSQIDCTINEIILHKPISESLWDTRQTSVYWEETCIYTSESECREDDTFFKKVVTPTPEPEYKIVPGTSQILKLCVHAIADYSDYHCDVNCIDFENTLMLQTREWKLNLQNIGKVSLNYSWDLIMDELYPIRLDEAKVKADLNCESRESVCEKKCKFRVTTVEPIDNRKSKKMKALQPELSDLFSSSAGLTNRSTDTWIEGDDWPFTITPENGSISPEENIICTLKFSPVEVFQYKAYLQCKMENLCPTRSPLNIVINATSLLPYCHFEIQESDYLTSGRRDIKLPMPSGYSPADADAINKIKVVEFKMLGVGECHTREIQVINPTTEEFSYYWIRLSNEMFEKSPALQCLAESGVLESGKRKKISFCIVPVDIGLFEYFWQFEIKKYDLKTLFLIVINVVEPCISHPNTLIKLETSAIGELKFSSFEIRNNEDCPLLFHVKPDSLYSEGRFQNITASPMSGTLNQNSSQTFNIQYKSSLIGEYTFNVLCEIEKLRKPIIISIVAQVIKLSAKLTYVELEDKEMELTTNSDNVIDIGQILLYEEMRFKFKITNTGPIGFDYSWHLNTVHENKFQISMSESEDRIDPNTTKLCYLQILVLEKLTIRNYSLELKIKYGPTYRLKLNASAKKPPVEFSFLLYDFGPSYIQPQTGIFYSVDLKISNHQKIFCPLKCIFKNNCNIKVNLNQLSQAIPPSSTIRIPIHFQPTEEKSYQKILYFSTSDRSVKQNVIVKGAGITYRIHLKNPCDAIIDFGPVVVGKCLCRKICMLNEGPVPVKLRIEAIEYSSEDSQEINNQTTNSSRSKDSCPSKPEIRSSITNYFDLSEFIEFSPTGLQNLKPNKEMEVSIKFKGVQRVKSLRAKLALKIDSLVLPLTMVKGSCFVASFYLNRTYISFGTIFEGCEANEKFVLINNGDLGSRFKWKDRKMESHFNMSPLSGYCSVGKEIVFTCNFTPNCTANCIQDEFNLELESHKSLMVNVAGNCSLMPKPLGTVEFSATIYQSEEKEINICNLSDKAWCLKPKIFGEYFTTDLDLIVGPKISQPCRVTYNPQKITTDGNLNKGKLIVIPPDGQQPILYDLHGRCCPAVLSEKIVRQIPAKKNFIQSLLVYNNTDRSQTFVCKIDPMDDIVKNFPVVALDVPAKKQIYCEFPFYFEREGHFSYKITFDDQQENYQCYDIEFIVSEPEIQCRIELTTYIRSSVFYMLKIENPLEHREVTFDANNFDEDVTIHGLPLTLPPLAFKNIKIEYLPIIPCDQKLMLEVTSDMFGSTFYELHLIAKPPRPEKAINVKSNLGKYVDFSLELRNYSKQPCDFDIMANESLFTCSKSVSVSPSEKIAVNVRFEPAMIGATNAIIKAKSKTAGEFVFPVIGQTSPPQPQGPFFFCPGQPVTIKFKNVFLKRKSFYFSVDNPDFVLNVTSQCIQSKESFDIVVQLRSNRSISREPKTGKLMVICNDKDANEVKWIYYLKVLEQ